MTGCAVPIAVAASAGLAAAEAGSSAWVRGELREAVFADLETVYEAAHAAMRDIEAEVKIERLNERSAYIMAQEDGGPDIRISMTRRTPKVTRIGVRVTIFGDLATSQVVMERLHAHLREHKHSLSNGG